MYIRPFCFLEVTGMEYSLQTLADGYRVAVNGTHRFGTDAFLLADFCAAAPNERVADIGTGCGIIPVIWAKNGRCVHICGVELQPDAAALAGESVRASAAEQKITVINDDIKNHRSFWTAGEFDLISCNPPYKKGGAGLTNPDPAKMTARHETACTMDDICAAAEYGLRWGGRLCVCHRPERLTDVLEAMRTHRIEPKRLRLVYQRANEEPWLILVEGRRGGKNGMRIDAPFYMEAADGSPSEALRAVYAGEKK